MSDKTAISWTDATWNPIAGCSIVSAGCTNCYAMREAHRLGERLGQEKYAGLTKVVNGRPVWNDQVRLWEAALDQPLRWTRPRRIFVNSMSDLFHEALPDEAIDRVFDVMAAAPQHTFQVLTKRPERMREYVSRRVAEAPRELTTDELRSIHELNDLLALSGNEIEVELIPWPLRNVWLGVSVEDQRSADERIPILLQTSAALRWVSYEPALGPVDFSWWLQPRFYEMGKPGHDPIPRLDWLVVGGESGPSARAFDIAWARETIAQCRAAGVPCFVKQLGARPVVNHRQEFDELTIGLMSHRAGADPAEWPEDLRVQGFPEAGT